MPFRTWMYIFAIIGLALADSGQAKEETQTEQGDSESQEAPSHLFKLPVLIDIIEDDSETQSRKSREEEASRNEIADLKAQQGMNESTKIIKDATLDMRDYAKYSTILVGFGTLLAFAAFWLSLGANKSARTAVVVMRNEQRPWMKIETVNGYHEQEGYKRATVSFTARNAGKKPAFAVRSGHFDAGPQPAIDHSRSEEEAVGLAKTNPSVGVVFPDDTIGHVKSFAIDLPLGEDTASKVACFAVLYESGADEDSLTYGSWIITVRTELSGFERVTGPDELIFSVNNISINAK